LILFSTLYHPCNKLAGFYNASAGIQYTGFDTDFPIVLGPSQYTFASSAQTYKFSIPADFTGDDFTLTNGTIKINGYITDGYGAHRYISLEEGKSGNMDAGAHTGFFGKLPDIHIRLNDDVSNRAPHIDTNRIRVYPNPFADFIIINSMTDDKATIYDLSGKPVLTIELTNGSNRINTSALPRGVYVLQTALKATKIVK